jgi:hypothetical protein
MFYSFHVDAQESRKKQKLVEISGIVKSELLQPLPFVHILIKNRNKGTITDQRGMFSFVATPRDTILFSAVGFKTMRIIIPDTLKYTHYPVEIIMPTDTIMIAEVKIFPWKTYAEFKQAVIDLELPDDDAIRARKNIALIKTQMRMRDEPNAYVNYRNVMAQEYERTMIAGQYPSISLLNPFNWAKFIKALQEGKFRKDYYEDN